MHSTAAIISPSSSSAPAEVATTTKKPQQNECGKISPKKKVEKKVNTQQKKKKRNKRKHWKKETTEKKINLGIPHDNFPLLSVLYQFCGPLLKFGRAALSNIYHEFEWNSPQVFRSCVCAFAVEFDPGVLCHLVLTWHSSCKLYYERRAEYVYVRERKGNRDGMREREREIERVTSYCHIIIIMMDLWNFILWENFRHGNGPAIEGGKERRRGWWVVECSRGDIAFLTAMFGIPLLYKLHLWNSLITILNWRRVGPQTSTINELCFFVFFCWLVCLLVWLVRNPNDFVCGMCGFVFHSLSILSTKRLRQSNRRHTYYIVYIIGHLMEMH